jgi:hypothetical protein
MVKAIYMNTVQQSTVSVNFETEGVRGSIDNPNRKKMVYPG